MMLDTLLTGSNNELREAGAPVLALSPGRC